MSKDEKARMAYEAREAEIHDQMTRIKTAREEGINFGMEKGMNKRNIEIAKKLLTKGFDTDLVIETTGLGKEVIYKLAKE